MISAGEVIDGTEAKLLANGKKKIDITTKNVVDKAVRPVRPPLATPDEDSMYALVGVLPNKEAVSRFTSFSLKAEAGSVTILPANELSLHRHCGTLLYGKVISVLTVRYLW